MLFVITAAFAAVSVLHIVFGELASLEDRLGARLLHRTTREVRLTDVGELYFERCQEVLARARAADQLVAETRALVESPTTALTLGVGIKRYLSPDFAIGLEGGARTQLGFYSDEYESDDDEEEEDEER